MFEHVETCYKLKIVTFLNSTLQDRLRLVFNWKILPIRSELRHIKYENFLEEIMCVCELDHKIRFSVFSVKLKFFQWHSAYKNVMQVSWVDRAKEWVIYQGDPALSVRFLDEAR